MPPLASPHHGGARLPDARSSKPHSAILICHARRKWSISDFDVIDSGSAGAHAVVLLHGFPQDWLPETEPDAVADAILARTRSLRVRRADSRFSAQSHESRPNKRIPAIFAAWCVETCAKG
jgi:hypothetical protein